MSTIDPKMQIFSAQMGQQAARKREAEISVVVLNSINPGKRVIRIEIPWEKEAEVVEKVEKTLKVKADVRHYEG